MTKPTQSLSIKIMVVCIMLCVSLLPILSARAEPSPKEQIASIERALSAGDFETAYRESIILRKTFPSFVRGSVNGKNSAMTDGVMNTIRYLKEAAIFKNSLEKYNSSKKTSSDLANLREAFNNVDPWRKTLANSKLYFSDEFIAYLNTTIKSITENFDSSSREFKEVEHRRELARQEEERLAREQQEEERRVSEEARLRKEKEQEKRDEKDRLAREAAERDEDKKQQEKFAALDKLARGKGYAGLSDSGIAIFLYNAQHGGDLQDGINKVFWSDISPQAKKSDGKFKALQCLDGNVLYQLISYHGQELVDITLLVQQDSSLCIENQTLRNRYHVYVGNISYETVLGTPRTVPAFKPVDLN